MKEFKLRDGSVVAFDGMNANATIDGKAVTLDTAIAQSIGNGFMDADGAVFFARQLEHIKARSYDVQYAELKARSLFPVSSEAGAGATTITYRTYEQAGAAKIIEAYANDLPRADIAGKETTIPIRSVGTSYGYNVDEIQSSQMTGASLDQRRANAARRSVEQTVNDVAFYGDAVSGMPGFLSNPNIPQGQVVNPGSGTEWVNKTPDEILFDINDLFGDIFETTKMVEQGNTLLIPPSQWNYIMSTPRASNSDTTIAAFVAANSPFLSGLESIIAVNELAAANNGDFFGNSDDVMIAYDRSPDKVQLEIPVELEFMPVQQKNLEFVVPGRSRLAGVNVYYPLSAAFGLGI